MLWQYTVTVRSYRWILQTEQKGFAKKPSAGRCVFDTIAILCFLLLILALSLYLLCSLRDGSLSLPAILKNIAILLFLAVYLFFFATRSHSPRPFQKSGRILGSCSIRVENGWFYFMRAFTNGEYYFFRRPLRELTRVQLQNRGILIEYPGLLRFFLPQEAFSGCSAEQSQRFIQAQCLASLKAPKAPDPLVAPFSDMRRIGGEPLHSCSYHIPYQDRGQLYLECQHAMRKHPPFYVESNILQCTLVILCLICFSAAARWNAGIFFAILVVLWIYIFQPFVYLPLIVRKLVKDHTFYPLSEPCKISLYKDFFTASTPDSVLLKPYSLLAGLYESHNCYCLITRSSPLLFFCIPRKAFPDTREEEEFADYLWSALEFEKFWRK